MNRGKSPAVSNPEKTDSAGNDAKSSSSESWQSLAKIAAILGSSGGLLLHLIGYVSHQSYLSEWGIDPGLFPKPIDEVVMTGYFALMERTVGILPLLAGELWKVGCIWGLIVAYAYFLFRLEKSDNREKARRIFRRVPDRGVDLAKSLFGATVTIAIFPVGLWFAFAVMVIPAVLGDSFGRSLAQKEQKKFAAGCEKVVKGTRCFEVLKDGKRVAHGFLIDSTLTHIALFDVEAKRPRAILRDGTELLADVQHIPNEGADHE